MHEKVILLATPVFFILIGLEFLVGMLRRRNTYRLNDTLNSLALGIVSQVSGVFMQLLNIGLYALAVERVAIWHPPSDQTWVYLSALLLYDFCYYWLHRMGHEVNVLWAAHVVHHQSEAYNLSTALRQTSSGALLGWIFYLPLAFVGFPVEVFAAVTLIDLLYQFWIHTEQVGNLGWFDRVFASPSNHRVHHAVNDRYLDRNYGGILILWDRLFGTFEPEHVDEPPVYGTRAPLRSWNPLWANFEVYAAMARDVWRTRALRDKLAVLFARPGWQPEDLAQTHPKQPFDIERSQFDPDVAKRIKVFCVVQFVALLAMTTQFLALKDSVGDIELLAYAAFIIASLMINGAMLEGRPGAFKAEFVRLSVCAVLTCVAHRWFGIAHLDAAATIAITLFFAAGAIAIPFIARGSLSQDALGRQA
jgi:alkylglycerol monooxygenase